MNYRDCLGARNLRRAVKREGASGVLEFKSSERRQSNEAKY